MSEGLKELSLRIDALERVAVDRTSRATQLSDDEIKAYLKVRDVVAPDYGQFCGINDCYRCVIVRCISNCQALCDVSCSPCDVECSCGPCNIGGGLRSRVNRFGSMG